MFSYLFPPLMSEWAIVMPRMTTQLYMWISLKTCRVVTTSSVGSERKALTKTF